MHTRRTRFLVAIGVLVLWCGLVVGMTSQATAGGACPVTYTVVRGDTLGRIARRFDLSLRELIRLNAPVIRNPNLIYPGQVLCVSATQPTVVPTETPTETPAAPQLAIEVTYQYEPADDETEIGVTARGGYIGKRTIFPLETITPVVFITETEQMRGAISNVMTPTMLLVRDSATPATYELVLIGEGPPLSSTLLISQTGAIDIPPDVCSGPEVMDVLGSGDVQEVHVTVWLEPNAELRYPFHISRINRQPTAGTAADCYDQSNITVALILAPSAAESGTYQAHVLLEDEKFIGPGGTIQKANCTRWAGKRGFWYWFLRALARCGR